MPDHMSADVERGQREPDRDTDDADYGWSPEDPAEQYPDEEEPW